MSAWFEKYLKDFVETRIEKNVCVTPSKIKIETIQESQKSRSWDMKDDWYKKQPRQDLDVCGYSFARYSEKSFTQIYRALYGDAMLVPFRGSPTRWP